VQDVDRRVEGLQHGQRGHVDTTDRQTDGMAPQMVDQRFDLGKFGHATSLPIAMLRCLTGDCRHARGAGSRLVAALADGAVERSAALTQLADGPGGTADSARVARRPGLAT
jgi:hypothetical protein